MTTIFILLEIIQVLGTTAEYLLMGYIILGWFIIFGAIKNRNSIFFKFHAFLANYIEPILAKIRTIIPPIGNFDLSILAIFLGLYFVKILLFKLAIIFW
jgi:YggT family protein